MNIEYEITKIKNQLQNLQDIVLQMSRNSVPTTSKVDDTANKVEVLTPYTDTKTAYIGDTEIVFNGVPSGCVAVYLNGVLNSNIIRQTETDRVVVYFETPLEEVTEVTISIS